MDTPKAQEGTWTLTAPDGRTWQADSPIRCVSMERQERVPDHVTLQRIIEAFKDTPVSDTCENHQLSQIRAENLRLRETLRDISDIHPENTSSMFWVVKVALKALETPNA